MNEIQAVATFLVTSASICCSCLLQLGMLLFWIAASFVYIFTIHGDKRWWDSMCRQSAVWGFRVLLFGGVFGFGVFVFVFFFAIF